MPENDLDQAFCMYKRGNQKSLNLNPSNCSSVWTSAKHILLFDIGLQHLKLNIRNFIFPGKNDFTVAYIFTMVKALVKIIFGHKTFICEPIFKILVALFKTWTR